MSKVCGVCVCVECLYAHAHNMCSTQPYRSRVIFRELLIMWSGFLCILSGLFGFVLLMYVTLDDEHIESMVDSYTYCKISETIRCNQRAMSIWPASTKDTKQSS